MFPEHRPRRLRVTPAMRRLVAETTLRPRQLVLPMFVAEGADSPRPIASMPGVVQHTRDSLRKAAVDAVRAGVGGLMIFGVPVATDAVGSGATDENGILNVALRDLKASRAPPQANRTQPQPKERRLTYPHPSDISNWLKS